MSTARFQIARCLLLASLLVATSSGLASAQSNQVLHIAVGKDAGKLNPHDYSANFVGLSAVYEGLVKYGQGGKIEPVLARSWVISPDGRTITFKLRSGVVFQDGTPFNSAAVKWNFTRWLHVKDHNWLNVTDNIVAVETPDPLTVVLKFKTYNDSVLHELALARPVRFLSPRSVNAKGEFVQAVGTGPWQVDSYVSGQRLVLKPFARYWGGGKPKLSQVSFEVIPDPQTRVAALLSGQVDLIGGEYLGTVPLESVPALRANPDLTVLNTPGSTTYILQTHYQQAPWNDQRVRQALNAAIDRRTISAALFQGLAQPAVGILPPSVPYVTPGQPSTYAYNPALATRLMKEAGWTPGADGMLQKDGKPFTFTLLAQENVYPQSKQLAEVLQAQLKKVGMALKIEIVNDAAFYDRLQHGNFDLATNLTWGAPYDPYASVVTMFKSFAGKDESSSSSNSIYSNAALNKLVDASLSTRTEAQRRDRYSRIWRYVDSKAAGVPLVSVDRLYAFNKHVTGLKLGSTEYELDFSNVQIQGR